MSPVGTYHPGAELEVEWLFNAGVNRSMAAHMIADGECRVINNAYYPREMPSLRTRPGAVLYDTGKATEGQASIESITAICEYRGGGSGTTLVCATGIHTNGTKQGLYYLNASEQWVVVDADLGSTGKPCLCVFGGYLLIAIQGQYIKAWNGYTNTADPAPARAFGKVTVDSYGAIVVGQQLTVGATTFTFQTQRSQPWEIEIGGSNDACATNIAAAIAIDCWDVEATAATNVVSITARQTGGTAPSYLDYPFVDGTAAAALTLTGNGYLRDNTDDGITAANGMQLDIIDSYQAPQPGILIVDKNTGRLVASGAAAPLGDRLYFSAPGNPWQWASGDYGSGEWWDVGYKDGASVSAVVSHLGELIVHKTGANREMYRINISDPDPATWSMQQRFFNGTTAAVNNLCALSVADKHLSLEDDFFRVFTGNDSFDELRSGVDANKVFDYLDGTSATTAFMAANPYELYVLIFPAAGSSCLVLAPGSMRWTHWDFSIGSNIQCAAYIETLGTMLLGCANGHVYYLDGSASADAGTVFETVIVGRAVNGGLSSLLLKFCSLEYENIRDGSGTLKMLTDLNESVLLSICSFSIRDQASYVFTATTLVYEADEEVAASEAYNMVVSRQEAKGPKLMPRLQFTGAATINNLTAKIAKVGLKGEA